MKLTLTMQNTSKETVFTTSVDSVIQQLPCGVWGTPMRPEILLQLSHTEGLSELSRSPIWS